MYHMYLNFADFADLGKIAKLSRGEKIAIGHPRNLNPHKKF